MHEAPPPSRVPALLADHPPADAKKTRSSPRPRQLRHPQAFQREDMAGQAPPLSPAFHPHFGLLAQSGRALLRPDHSGAHPSRRLHFGPRARSGHSRLPATPQCRPQALRLDQVRPRNPGKSHPRAKRAPTACFRESSVKFITLGTRRGAAAWPRPCGNGRNGSGAVGWLRSAGPRFRLPPSRRWPITKMTRPAPRDHADAGRSSLQPRHDPTPSLGNPARWKNPNFSGNQEPERVDRQPDPVDIRHDGNPFPAREMPDADSEVFPYCAGIHSRKFAPQLVVAPHLLTAPERCLDGWDKDFVVVPPGHAPL